MAAGRDGKDDPSDSQWSLKRYLPKSAPGERRRKNGSNSQPKSAHEERRRQNGSNSQQKSAPEEKRGQNRSKSQPKSAHEDRLGQNGPNSQPKSVPEERRTQNGSNSQQYLAHEERRGQNGSNSQPKSAPENRRSQNRSKSQPKSAHEDRLGQNGPNSQSKSAHEDRRSRNGSNIQPKSVPEEIRTQNGSNSQQYLAHEERRGQNGSNSQPKSAPENRRSQNRSQSQPKSAPEDTRGQNGSKSQPKSAPGERRGQNGSNSQPKSAPGERHGQNGSNDQPKSAQGERRGQNRAKSQQLSAPEERRSQNGSNRQPKSAPVERRCQNRSKSQPLSATDDRRGQHGSYSQPKSTQEERRSQNGSKGQSKSAPEERRSQNGSNIHKRPNRRSEESQSNFRPHEERQSNFRNCEEDQSESIWSLKKYLPKSAPEENHSQQTSNNHTGPGRCLEEIRPNGLENVIRKEKHDSEERPRLRHPLSRADLLPQKAKEQRSNQSAENSLPRRSSTQENKVKRSVAVGKTDSHNQRNRRTDKASRKRDENKKAADFASGEASKYQSEKSDLPNNTKQTVDLHMLKTWAEIGDANNVVLLISSQMNQLEMLLNQPKLQEDCLVSIIKAVSNALNAHHKQEPVKQLLDRFCRTKFFDHLILYIKEKQISDTAWDDALQFLICCSKILEEILNKLPRFAKTCLTVASDLLDTARITKSVQRNISLLADITSLYEKSKKVFLAENKFEQKTRGGLCMSNNLEEPPDNFLDLPIIPSKMDLQEDANPFIRSIRIEGCYTDIHQYLDVQFRLMRQDFIIPLREGLAEFKKNHGKKGFRSSYLRFYFNVRIVGTIFNKGIDHVLRVDDFKLKQIQRQNSKCLMFGNLLCLSKDNFETVIFATVAHDVTELDKGFIVVNVITGIDDVFNSSSNDVYVMAETQAYFQSYCHVLEGLQEMITKLPLQDYIIHCRTELKPPRYLLSTGEVRRLPVYDLTCLMKGKLACKVPVLTTVKWPKTNVTCLNESQKAAAQLALTKELAIIQGPPGTGKTYVGLKVMQVLLENKHIMTGSVKYRSDPILVVCYTNHALDQFLEGVLKFCPNGIVRVGGQSKSEQLKMFNLSEIRRRWRRGKGKYVCVSDKMRDISYKINALQETMESLQTDILKEYTVAKYISTIHLKSLLCERANLKSEYDRANIESDGDHIHAWLTTSKQTTQSILSKMIKRHLIMHILKKKEELTSEKLSTLFPSMNIIQRAHFYCYYLKRYEQTYEREMQQLSTKPVTLERTYRMHEIEYWLKTARTHILPDHQLGMILPEGVYETIWESLHQLYTSMSDNSDNVIESWLLGPEKSLHQQLDDVQMLTQISSHKADDHESLGPGYTFMKEQNDRMIDDDACYRDQVRTLVKTVVNSLESAIKRAEALGIRDDVLMDDDVENDEWETVTTRKLNVRAVHRKLRFIKPMTQEEESHVTSVWDLELDKRFALYNSWVQRYKIDLTEEMEELVHEYKSEQEKQKIAENKENLDLLRKAKVIGMTTSGAARLRSVLQALGCRIIVVEEAAEVLESHIVTSLNENCKHLILIGDHQQLRPNPTVYQLAKDFGLEISLFERLIKNKVPHVMLKEQHRMRPEISEIMRHIYPDLQDHPSVANHERIRGMSKNIFFIQHEHKETHLHDSMSKANTHEAKFLVALCQYLLNQDYKPSQITILATYSGQVSEIKKVMREQHLDPTVLVTTVDNYQGEENDIILLSLVRSNTENKVGFLKVDNRVCVALSRAKRGLYAIGNLKLMASHSKLWKKIVETATSKETIDTHLGVHCHNHPDFREFMNTEKDFQKCPEGGCGVPCMYRLKCGHVCEKLCHGYDLEHTVYKCPKACAKTCSNGHPCQLRCYEECICRVLVLKQMPVCGHEDKVMCYVPAEEAVCSLGCSSVLDCGHQCSGYCGQCTKNKEHDKCLVKVQHQWPCGHSETVPCYTTKLDYRCRQVCGAKRDCGHECPGICGQCRKHGKHDECHVKVQHQWPCGHSETVPCYTTKLDYRCRQVCGAKRDCGHECSGICGQCRKNGKHDECHVKVQHQWPCGHSETVPCYITKLDYRCRQVCGAKRDCGHVCSGICGQCREHGKHNECTVKVQHQWPCGHYETVPCYTTKLDYRCRQVCKAKRDCGHKCYGICGQCRKQGKHHECHVNVEHQWPCGHNETVPCHITKLDNRCRQVCGAKLDCGHACSGICGQCNKIGAHAACKVPIAYQRPCGHTEDMPCYQEKPTYNCQSVCGVDLECGHQCAGMCSRCEKEGEHRECNVPVKYRKNCGHADEIPCHVKPSPKLPCKHVCGAELKCGHICKGICSKCLHGRVHPACPEKCALLLPCGHTCGGFCGVPCLPCAHLCPN